MSDLISRQAAIEAMRELPHEYNTKEQRARTGGIAACQTIIRELPSVQPKTGQWKEILVHRDDEGDILRDYECTNCLGIICDVPDDDEKELPRFCCMCGAEMEENENE